MPSTTDRCGSPSWRQRAPAAPASGPCHPPWRTLTHQHRLPDPKRISLAGWVGRVYVPFLLANATALERGAEQVECVIDGRPWVQRLFPYQGKCLRWLRADYAALPGEDRVAVDALLAGTGCEPLLQ